MKTYLEPKEIDRIEQAAECLRDKLLVRLLARLGCRVSEALGIFEEEIKPLINKMQSDNIILPMEEKGQIIYLHYKWYNQALQQLIETLSDFHIKNPTKRGINKTFRACQ